MKKIFVLICCIFLFFSVFSQSKNTSVEVLDYRTVDGKIVLELLVNDIKADFVLDINGANAVLPEYVEKLKIDHDDRARLLLEDQLKRHPGDARLERSLAAIPVEVKSVTTVEELLAQQKACDAAPTLRCRSEVGQNALRLAQLPVARAQLNDATFAASPEGKTLRTDLLQRAIYLKQWSQADTLYNEARQQT